MEKYIAVDPLSDSVDTNTEKKEKIEFGFSFDHGETSYLMNARYWVHGTLTPEGYRSMSLEEDEIRSGKPRSSKTEEYEKFIFSFVEKHLPELQKVVNENCWTTFDVTIDSLGKVEVEHSYWYGEGSNVGDEKTFTYNPNTGIYKTSNL